MRINNQYKSAIEIGLFLSLSTIEFSLRAPHSNRSRCVANSVYFLRQTNCRATYWIGCKLMRGSGKL